MPKLFLPPADDQIRFGFALLEKEERTQKIEASKKRSARWPARYRRGFNVILPR
jgi:hypothetical protein